MDTSSLLLTPSSAQQCGLASRKTLTSSSPSSLLMDVVPFEAALQRLLYEKVRSDEQLSSYGVQQAYRGLLYAVRAGTLSLSDVGAGREAGLPAPIARPSTDPSAKKSGSCIPTVSSSTRGNSDDASGTTNTVHAVRGWQAVLYRLALAAVRSASDLECAVFLSVRILCDPASAYGEGNEHPCCTAEWTHALLHGLPLDDGVLSSLPTARDSPDDRFALLVQTSHRYQLGYLLLLSNTLRMVATERVGGQHLCSSYPDLFSGVVKGVLPLVARHVEVGLRETAETAPSAPHCSEAGGNSGVPSSTSERSIPPSRLSAEFNHLLIHGGYWLAMDALSAHIDAEDGEHGGADKQWREKRRKAKRHPLVLDRDQPAYLWGCVTSVRNALRRTLTWLMEEVRRRESETFTAERKPCNPNSASAALLKEVLLQLEGSFTDLLKKHEYLQNALLNATRDYSGVVTRDVHALTKMAWANTLQMCFLLRNLTGVWVIVHGGLGYSSLCADQLLSSNRDVLMFMASCLVRIPTLDTTCEGERESFLALDAALCALVALVAAAPTADLQADLWASDNAVTQQVHAVLVQRALRYRSERVLKLASLLSRAVLDATVRHGALAGFASDSADQLLELLESDHGDDAASRCVGELLSVAILQHPYRLVPALFRLLQHGSAATRRRVLQVLCSLPDVLSDGFERSATYTSAIREESDGEAWTSLEGQRVNGSGTAPSSRADNRHREVLRLLAENLLLQLQDEELCVRLLSSALFAKVHPMDVMQPLLNLCCQRDNTGRKQSAALAALTRVLTSHTHDAATFVLLLRSAYPLHSCANRKKVLDCAAPLAQVADAEHSRLETEVPPASTDARRPVPRTPGDILSQTLLYSTVDASESDDDDDHEDDVVNKEVDSKTASKPTGARLREAHLNSALLHLTDEWVQAALRTWTYEKHSLPLVHFLAQQAFGEPTTAAAGSMPPGQGAEIEDRVQFFMKYTLRATSVLTRATPGAALSSSNTSVEVRVARACHLRAIWSVFFASREGGPERTPIANCEAWNTVVECSSEKLRGVAQDSTEARSRVHAALLPLLCLCRCDPGTFADLPLHDVVCLSTSLPSFAHPGEADTVREAESAPRYSKMLDDEATCGSLVAALWRSLWSAIVQTDATKAFFTLYPVIQRVVLEVLCRFPAAAFFSQWQRWQLSIVGSDGKERSATSLDTAAGLLVYRVYVYGVSTYLAAASLSDGSSPQQPVRLAIATEPSTLLDFVVSDDLMAVVQHCHTLVHLLTTVLPQWLMEDSAIPPSSSPTGANDTDLEAAKKRLCVTAVDAAGIVGVVALALPQVLVSSHLSPSVEVDLLKNQLGSTFDELLSAPLSNLTLAYRATKVVDKVNEPRTSTADTNTVDGSNDAIERKGMPAEPSWTPLLTRFQLCLRSHASLLRAVTAHPRGPKGLLLMWFRHFLRTFVELSNAACKSEVGRTTHACRAAVDACGTVFQAVLIARKMDDVTAGRQTPAAGSLGSTSHPIAEAASAAVSPTLCRLAWEEKDALVNFAVGCTRFAASPAVQTVGVRLLSSLLVAAPEIFLDVGAQGTAKTVATVGSAAGGDALQAAMSALESVALMHTDRTTRVLAEEVLRMLEKAFSAANEVS
jgi:hypothetical protein